MANVVYKRLFKLALVALLAGCASKPVPHYVEYPNQVRYPKNTNQQSKISPTPNPVDRLIQQYPNNYGRSPYSSSYGAPILTGTYANSPAVRNFIQHMVHKYGFSETYLNGLFSRANRLDSVIRLES
ncbi:MAG: lytic murein transglycosylase, partial [Methylococcaceae bacterium]